MSVHDFSSAALSHLSGDAQTSQTTAEQKQKIEKVAARITFERADLNQDGRVDKGEFENAVLPELLRRLACDPSLDPKSCCCMCAKTFS